MYLRDGLPEVGDFVIATVDGVSFHKVELTLDEYKDSKAVLNTSEMHRKQVRTLKVFFKLGRKIVGKVIKSGPSGIDLSIRKVGASQERTKETEWKNEKIADEIISFAAKQANIDYDKAFAKIGKPLLDKYGLIFPFFSEVVSDNALLNELKLDKKLKESLISVVQGRIKIKTANLKFKVTMESKSPNGLEVIKKTVKDAIKFAEEKEGELTVKYIGAPIYRFEFKHPDQKGASKIVEELFDSLSKQLNKEKGTIESVEIK
jgi:translation initiation factor 2 subunit 1